MNNELQRIWNASCIYVEVLRKTKNLSQDLRSAGRNFKSGRPAKKGEVQKDSCMTFGFQNSIVNALK